MIMSETIFIKKKKYDYEAIAKRLRPLVKKWKDVDKEVAYEIHKEYMLCPSFHALCIKIGCNESTMYRLFDKYELPRKQPTKAEAIQESWDERKEQESETMFVVDVTQNEIDEIQFKETYSILKKAQSLSKTMFDVPEKQELVEELQHTVKELTTLLLKLESNLEE